MTRKVAENNILTAANLIVRDNVRTERRLKKCTDIALRGIRGTQEVPLKDKWAKGARAHLGMASAGFPNWLYIYGPHSPSAFTNGPTCAELQGELVVEGLEYMRQRGLTRIEATTVAEESWKNYSIELSQAGLFTQAGRARKRAMRDLR